MIYKGEEVQRRRPLGYDACKDDAPSCKADSGLTVTIYLPEHQEQQFKQGVTNHKNEKQDTYHPRPSSHAHDPYYDMEKGGRASFSLSMFAANA
mmetsp:Transcript_1104/g.2051  ORF Transcript_1104/g.2051 Transcript_1104/m.2051 type:complete len:94 (+) Transcript_1104:1364-1645(+)